MTRYILRGVNDSGEIVEVTVDSQRMERRRGHLEGQGYRVEVIRLGEPPVGLKTTTKSSATSSAAPASSAGLATSSGTSWFGVLLCIVALAGIALAGWAMWTLLWSVGMLAFLILMVPIGIVIGVVGVMIEALVNRRRK